MSFDFEQAFESFMETDFQATVDKSTKASCCEGSKYYVELFADGSYRVLWEKNIGNLYDSSGLILGIPPLSDEEWDDDPDIRFYGNVEQEIREKIYQ